MDNRGSIKQAVLGNCKPWRWFSVHRNTQRSWTRQSNDNSKNNRNNKRHRKYLYLFAINLLCLGSPAKASDIGGVSATANPVANSSGSVTNQAIQVLQGPYITNTYGNGIQCQGPTLNISPFVTGTNSFALPYEATYKDPVYDTTDIDEDGLLDNPGGILYYKDVRTGQKNNHSINLGVTATFSMPLDRKLQDQCKEAVATQVDLQRQILANRRLDFEIARLKNCGELAKAGITFHPKSKYFKICEDVVVRILSDEIPSHTHSISLTPAAKPKSHDSDHAEQSSAQTQTPPSGTVLSTKQSSSLSSSQ